MSHEDRDRKFEQTLERHLRHNVAGTRNEADAPADVRDETMGPVTCPDAEILAAFHERALSNEEMNIAAEHIEWCSRCQHILVQLEATDGVPLQTAPEDVFAVREPALSTGALCVDDAARQTSSPSIAGQPEPALKAPRDISRGRGFKALRWAAPAGAIAAGLLIWFVARDHKVQTLGHVENVKIAQEQPRDERLAAAPPLPTAPAPEPIAKPKQLNRERKEERKIKQPAEESEAFGAPENSASGTFSTGADLEARAGTSDAKARQLPTESRDYASPAAAADKPLEIPSRHADAAVTAAAPAIAGAPRAQSAAPAREAAKTVATEKSNATSTIETHPNGDNQLLATQQVVALNQLEPPPSLKKDGIEKAKIILASNGTVRWRLLSAGRIEQSVDSGITWRPQNIGVKADLLAGSAPSEAVCWIVGRRGTILRTTDGGGHWSKVVSPMGGDVAGVEAVDAMTAEIFNANRSGRFVTHDGGATWEAAKD